MSDRAWLRRTVWKIATRLPVGVGRYVREHTRMKAELRQVRRLRSEHEAVCAERDTLRSRWSVERRTTQKYGLAYRALLAEVMNLTPEELGPVKGKPPSPERSASHRARVQNMRERAGLADRLRSGEPLERAVATVVRRLLADGDPVAALSLSHSLRANPATQLAGRLGAALVAAAQDWPEPAWASFRETPPELWRQLAPVEFIRMAFQADPDTAVRQTRSLLTDPPGDLTPEDWLGLVGIAFGARHEHLACDLFEFAEALARKNPDRWAATDGERDWLRPWLGQVVRPAPPPVVPAGHLSLAILDYRQPCRAEASKNIGDWVQTVASLGQLVRHRNVRFHGPPELVSVVDELRDRLRPELSLDTAARDVTLVPVARDASGYCAIPEHTWALTFGWFMQSIFGRYDFPLHPHLRPIFVSFHCNRREMLSAEAIAYLREHGPIGCRDWSTVDLLLSAGVPAFFSGCLTTTLGGVFPDLDPQDRPGRDAPIAYVDVEPPEGTVPVTHSTEQVHHADLPANLRRSIELLESYRRRYSRVVTSRLHCYLPARAIGATVDFRPRNPADIRYHGLVGRDAPVAAIRQGIQAKLAAVWEAILAGREPADVYAVWRQVCAEDVEAARSRRTSVPPIPPLPFDLAAACAEIRSREVVIGATAGGPELHVALSVDRNLTRQLGVVVQAMLDNSSQPLHLWILCRDHKPDDFARFGALFPEMRVTWLPCDKVDYGPLNGLARHATVSTMDRLLLADLLPHERIVYLDVDTLPLADLAELSGWDLQGHPLAARSAVAPDLTSGFARVVRSSKRLGHDPGTAGELLQRMHARHDYDYLAFDAGVLVLDLAAMRVDGFGNELLPFVARYRLTDQEVLNCYAGPNRAALPPQWNAHPALEDVADPRIVHWAGPRKPWHHEYVAMREVWEQYERRLADREQ